jgi:plasmid stability protein
VERNNTGSGPDPASFEIPIETCGDFPVEKRLGIHYGSIMATITLKNIPAPIHRALKIRAEANHRSINRETIDCLERVLLNKPMNVETFLERVSHFREQTPGRLTEKLLEDARRTGRP